MNNLKSVMDYLISKGLTVQAAAGIYGNLYAESNCRPEARDDKAKEIGIAQETAGGYDRYLAYAKKQGKAWDDIFCQLDFVLDNCINNRYKWQAKVDGDTSQQYGSVTHARECGYTVDLVDWESFVRSQNIGQTATSFLCIYEDCLYSWTAKFYGRPSLASWIQEQMTNRCLYAKQAYEEYKEIIMTQSPKQNYPPQNAIPYASGTIGSDGCGVAMIMAIMGWTSLDKWNYVAQWMKDHGEHDIGPYACASGGTWAQGIPAFLNAHGVSADKLTGVHSEAGLARTSAKLALRVHVQNGGRAWICVGGVATGCPSDYWTRAGHYLGITKYDAVNDLYYVTDSASTVREGWHTWEEIEEYIKHCGRIDLATQKKVEDEPMYKQAKKLDTSCHSGKNQMYVLLFQEIARARDIKAPKEYGGNGELLKLDRDYGQNCTAVCKVLQKQAGQPLTGVADEKLWKALLGGI